MTLEFQSSVCFKVALIDIALETRGMIQLVSLEARYMNCFKRTSREIAVQVSAMTDFMPFKAARTVDSYRNRKQKSLQPHS